MTMHNSFIEAYNYKTAEYRRKLDKWLAVMSNLGVMAAHPDNGWVNWDENWFVLQYPHFDKGATIGDKVALGNAKKYNIVVVKDAKILTNGTIRYYF